MASSVIPLIPSQNQSITSTIPINSQNITLTFQFTYNMPGGYWYMSITQAGNLLVDAIPLVTGDYPAGNLLRQYAYLGIGEAYIVPVSSAYTNNPDFDQLGIDYVLVWSDGTV